MCVGLKCYCFNDVEFESGGWMKLCVSNVLVLIAYNCVSAMCCGAWICKPTTSTPRQTSCAKRCLMRCRSEPLKTSRACIANMHAPHTYITSHYTTSSHITPHHTNHTMRTHCQPHDGDPLPLTRWRPTANQTKVTHC